MGRKKQKKNTSRRPPLSLIDKCIYYLAILVSFIGSIMIAFQLEHLQEAIAFIDPTVIANNVHASFLFVLPFVIYVELSTIIFFGVQLSNKTPIFGNSKIQYGQTPWDKNCFPLFDCRRKNINKRPSAVKFRRRMLAVWSVGFLIVLMMAPLGLFGRDCLHNDYSINSYNTINHVSDKVYSTGDYRHLTLKTIYYSGYRGGSYWCYGMDIEMTDGKTFKFNSREFDYRDADYKDNCLKTMSEIKQQFPSDSITITGADNVDKVADYIGLSEFQTNELQKLFTQYE